MIEPSTPDFDARPDGSRANFTYLPGGVVPPGVVTIVTPFFNAGPEFRETAGSVLSQSLQDFRWLIVDDGSRDSDALEMLEDLAGAEPRINVIRHAVNRGLPSARNSGFKAATTEFVLQIDADDLIEPTAAEKWFWYLETHPDVGFVNSWTVGFGAERYLYTRGFHERAEFLNENLVIPTAMIRRSVFDDVGGYDEALRTGLEDWEFWLRCANAGAWGVTLPEFLTWYRRRLDHSDRWVSWDRGPAQRAFRREMQRRYPNLSKRSFPAVFSHPKGVSSESRSIAPLAKTKRRLLLIVSWFVVGGADMFHLNLLDVLVAAGWEVTVVSTVKSSDPWLAEFTGRTSDVFRLPDFLPAEEWPRFLMSLIGTRQHDAVMISASDFGYAVTPWLRGAFPRLPIVDFCHVEEPHWKDGGYPRRSIEVSQHLDGTFVTSEHLRRWMVEREAEREKLTVCYIDVDPKSWAPDPDARRRTRMLMGTDAEVPVVLFAGRICDQKNPTVLANTAQLLEETLSLAFEIWIVGEGEDEPWLREFLRKHGIARTRMLGAATPQRMRELMNAADIFFLPSKFEGIALSLFEAMASGLAVVATDVGGQRELVSDDSGVLIPLSDSDELTSRSTSILGMLMSDVDRRRAIGSRARTRIIEHFSIDEMGRTVLRGLQSAIDHRASGRSAAADEATMGARREFAVREARRSAGFAAPEDTSAVLRYIQNGYAILASVGRPVYRWATSRGWRWPQRLRDALKQRLS